MSVLPDRPRLAAHALVRLHVIDGDERVIVHDARRDRVCALGPREWAVLSACDGTRDVTGLRLAARARGVRASEGGIRELLAQLADADFLADGPPLAPESATRTTPADRPLEPLPGYRFDCDGAGGCCSRYASVLFSPEDAARARAHCPDVRDGARDPARAFTPAEGTGSADLFAGAIVDGRCAYLAADGRCGIHAAGGGAAKPRSCQLYPRTFVDDGTCVRVTVLPECACAFASAGRNDGEPLVAEASVTRGDLAPEVYVELLPERIPLTSQCEASTEALSSWSRSLVALEIGGDVASATWRLARAVEISGLDVAGACAALGRGEPLTAGAVRPWIDALAVRAADRARGERTWRSANDPTRRVADAFAEACASLLVEGALERALSDAHDADEAFYLRTCLHGHLLVRDVPLAAALRDSAARMFAARALRTVLDRSRTLPPAMSARPLALVESLLRGHGVWAYVHDVAPSR